MRRSRHGTSQDCRRVWTSAFRTGNLWALSDQNAGYKGRGSEWWDGLAANDNVPRIDRSADRSFHNEGVNVRTYIKPPLALVAVGAIVLLVACAGGKSSNVTPAPAAFARHFTSHDSCPATGPIKYVADFVFNVVNIYAGKFAGQAPCGQIASS